MAEEHSGTIDERDHGETTAQWRRTLWAMVGIQFINTMAFSVLSPIMPLFLPVLGRNGECCRSVVRHPQRRHLLHRGLRLAAMGTRRRPPRPQADAAAPDARHRRAYRADGLGGKYLAILCVSRADGGVRRFSSAAIALVASQVPEGRLGFALGWLSTGQLVGSLVGPLIGGALADLTAATESHSTALRRRF